MRWIKKKLLFTLIMIIMFAVTIEVFATLAVYYKFKKYNLFTSNTSLGSAAYIIKRALVNLNILPEDIARYGLITSYPEPLMGPSDRHGYINLPGNYKIRYYDKNNANYHEAKVTILDDGTRNVGKSNKIVKNKVLVFGDSVLFGEGLSDEHTFTFMLQQKHPDIKFYLHAAGGWSLSNALVNIEMLKEEIGSNDIIVLGYGDYYNERHVASPRRMKHYERPNNLMPEGLGHLKILLGENGELLQTIIPLFCEKMISYCEQPNPSVEYMETVSSAIINKIVSAVDAKVVLLHFEGASNDPVLTGLNPKVELISATSETFQSKINDKIMEFNNHPGPFWHYALFSRLSKYFNEGGGR